MRVPLRNPQGVTFMLNKLESNTLSFKRALINYSNTQGHGGERGGGVKPLSKNNFKNK